MIAGLSLRAVAVTASIAINVLLVGGLVWLNRATSSDSRTRSLRVTVEPIRTTPTPEPPPIAEPPREERRTAPTNATPLPSPVTLAPALARPEFDAPRIAPPTARDVDLDLELTTIAVRGLGPTTDIAAAETPMPRASGPTEATGPLDADHVDRSPVPHATNAPIPYPRRAARRGIEGSVDVRLHIDPEGHVIAVDVLDGVVAREFERAIRETVRDWRFRPAEHAGRAVEVIAQQTLHFELPDRP